MLIFIFDLRIIFFNLFILILSFWSFDVLFLFEVFKDKENIYKV